MGLVRRLFGGRAQDQAEAFKSAGDRVEAAATDLERAKPLLRIVLLPSPAVPPGDVHRPTFAEGATEVLALDAGQSVRYVSETLAASWRAAPDELWQAAEAVTLRQPVKKLDRLDMGSRVIGMQVTDGTPAIAPFLRRLEDVAPEAVGALGTLVGMPDGSGCFLLALDRYDAVRSDIVDLAMLTFEVAQMPGLRLFPIPFWRAPDGRMRSVRLQMTEAGELLGAYDPAFAGVLCALDPINDLNVPEWAQALALDEYAEFAGLVAAASGIRPEDVADSRALRRGRLLEAWGAGSDVGARFVALSRQLESQSTGGGRPRPQENPVLDPSNEARLVAALAEPKLSSDEAKRFAGLLRRSVDELDDPGAVLGQLGYRQLVDIASECRTRPESEWPQIIRGQLQDLAVQTEELARLEEAGYGDVRPRLWPSLWPQPFVAPLGPGMRVLEDEPIPGLHRRVAFYATGARSRLVRSDHLRTWGVTQELVWNDAAENMIAAAKEVQPWPAHDAPVRIIRSSDRDSEMLGLLLHRLPEPCSHGYAVAIPFRGSALYLPLDAREVLSAIPVFAHLAANAFREATQFDDHLLPKLFWLTPEGAIVELCDLFRPPQRPDDLPQAFLTALATAGLSSGSGSTA